MVVTEGLDAKTKAVPLRFTVPLENIPAGRRARSRCWSRVRKAAFWQAPIVVVP